MSSWEWPKLHIPSDTIPVGLLWTSRHLVLSVSGWMTSGSGQRCGGLQAVEVEDVRDTPIDAT